MVLNQTVPGLSTWPRLFIALTLINMEFYSEPNFPFNATMAPRQEFWIDYISVQQITDATRNDHVITTALGTIVPVGVLSIFAMIIGIRIRHRRQRQGNMQKMDTGNSFVSKMFRFPNLLSHNDETLAMSSEFQDCIQRMEIPLASIRLTKIILASSETSVTLKGYSEGIPDQEKTTILAAKGPKSASDPCQLRLLTEEMETFVKAGQHMNILSLLGVVQKSKTLLLFEYAEFGTLPHYLHAHGGNWFYNQVDPNGNLLPYDEDLANQLQQACDTQPSENIQMDFDWQVLSTRSLLRFAYHVSRGVEYLHSRSIIHRNLSAGTIFICTGQVAKIGGLELAKQVTEYVAADRTEVLSLYHLAPESVGDYRFSAKSDMWSLCVVLWEMFSFGEVPYVDANLCKDAEILTFLQTGERLKRPEKCPKVLYDLLLECWEWKPDERKDASYITSALRSITDNVAEEPYLRLDYWYTQNNVVSSDSLTQNDSRM
ncbi:fibroblast growth factor receptor homolog 1-like isoform X2 [Paramacrobiotus metropolitanus]|nr:fibroblast growth factor receptor homolog 1-like isoform X2 [Paramacrobiotus metropolitanus]XP_055350351.1 fibroblast growth factor receptor homolog 1-like isoform X2 [Paramacrobiotus metropolitanus]